MKPTLTKLCEQCSKPLSGLQSKYCSRKCHNQSGNVRLQNYQAQQLRGIQRKTEFINSRGGKCEICGYSKNIAALCFHHKDPSLKELQLDLRSMSNNSLEKLSREVDKCMLLCHNCHMELHFPLAVMS